MTAVRLFLALWPGPAGRAATLAWQTAHRWPPGVRLTRGANLHLTLHFIGGVPADRLAPIVAGLDVPCGRIVLMLDHAETWRGGLVVLAPTTVPPELTALQARLVAPLQRLGLPVEDRPYRPHVTLARHAAGAELATPPPPVRWQAQGYVLAASAGGAYTVLRRYPAGAPG